MKVSEYKHIVVLTGAGISAESGLATFRDSNGLWEEHRVEDVATPEAYERDPQLVWRFYSMRRINAAEAKPNAAHLSLVEFATKHPNKMTLVTQNVDGLHERADELERLEIYPMHGTLNRSRCTACGVTYLDDYAYFDLSGNYAPTLTDLCSPGQRASTEYLHHYKLRYQNFLPLSPCCEKPLRPHIVWFGEVPLHLDKIDQVVNACDLFISIGTSGQVYPAAGFLKTAHKRGAKTIHLNREESVQMGWIDESIIGPATMTVPKLLES
jgi:NAD-dependent deacetylase